MDDNKNVGNNFIKEWDYFTIELINEDSRELTYAIRLVWEVFIEFEANDFTDEGVVEFQNFIDKDLIKEKLKNGSMTMLGCFHYGDLVGVAAFGAPSHINMLFVKKSYHRMGIATKMLEALYEICNAEEDQLEVTVNSSPYAVEIYHRMGFVDVDVEQSVNGMRFVPMLKSFKS